MNYHNSNNVSVVIPTCNRKTRLLSLLDDLNRSTYPLLEVIIVDSGEDRLKPDDYASDRFKVICLASERSVCIQRNAGIREARGAWIFLCDDDIGMPADYLQKLMTHITVHPEAGAVSGQVLQKEDDGQWRGRYPIRSTNDLFWPFIFQLTVWGDIECGNGFLAGRLQRYYQRKGNHISKAGWPVICDFSDPYFISPVYGLGASLVKREWLLSSPYDEVLDRHGIGDNYGVAMNFPAPGIHIVNEAFIYHHQEPAGRLFRPLQYFRRVLALDYFRQTSKRPRPVNKRWLLWSLTGNWLGFVRNKEGKMARAAFTAIRLIALGKNPYYLAARSNKKIVEPIL